MSPGARSAFGPREIHHKSHDCEQEEPEEQDLRDRRRCPCESAKAEGSRNQCQDEKHQRPFQKIGHNAQEKASALPSVNGALSRVKNIDFWPFFRGQLISHVAKWCGPGHFATAYPPVALVTNASYSGTRSAWFGEADEAIKKGLL